MANEIRLRINNVGGVITDNPLAIGATTINSPGFADLPTVDATSHLVLILDPQEVGGPAEIVRVTAHTAASTSCTVLRGQEGSLARSHVFNTTWFHGPVESDYVDIFTSSTRPAWAYEGMFGYETDTNKLVGWAGVDWAPRDAGGQLGYAQVTANQGSLGAAVTDLTGLSVAVTVGTGRRVQITGVVQFFSDTGDRGGNLIIAEGGVQLANAIGWSPVAGNTVTVHIRHVLTPSAGSHTYNLRAQHALGGVTTMFAAANAPASILVEDIGAA